MSEDPQEDQDLLDLRDSQEQLEPVVLKVTQVHQVGVATMVVQVQRACQAHLDHQATLETRELQVA